MFKSAPVITVAFGVVLLFTVTCGGGGQPAGSPGATPTGGTVTPAATGTPTAAAGGAVEGQITFVSDRTGGPGLFIMNADGSGVTTFAAGFDPAWSPDGSRIAFFASTAENPDLEIYVMKADGSGLTNLTNSPGPDRYPAWSPDGQRIAFTSGRDGNPEVYLMNADGSGQKRLTDDAAEDFAPDWSPDGSRIAFISDRDGACKVYLVDADGSNQTLLTDSRVADCDLGFGAESIDWSPDGGRIAFTCDDFQEDIEICAVNADGSGLTNVSNSPGLDVYPAWSPDGSQIVFSSWRDGDGSTAEIYVMNADGSGQTRLTDHAASDTRPVWVPGP